MAENKDKTDQSADFAADINDSLIANINHALRTPLGGVVGIMDLLSKTRLDKSQLKYTHMIDAGVFYYLTKPYEEDVFKSVLHSAMRQANRQSSLKTELQKHQTSFGFIDKAEFTIKKLNEAEDLACFIANCFPKPNTALPGLANLLMNAVEHGSLDIGYEAKTQLLHQGQWQNEIDKRADLDEYSDRTVRIALECNDEQISVRIEDDGNGFSWEQYLDIDPARALDAHGRGIAQANKISFDELQYNKKGNVVTAISKIGSGIQW